jgi:hypothetical protein
MSVLIFRRRGNGSSLEPLHLQLDKYRSLILKIPNHSARTTLSLLEKLPTDYSSRLIAAVACDVEETPLLDLSSVLWMLCFCECPDSPTDRPLTSQWLQPHRHRINHTDVF